MNATHAATTPAVHSRWTNDRFWHEVLREARRFAKQAHRHRVYRAMKKSEIRAEDGRIDASSTA